MPRILKYNQAKYAIFDLIATNHLKKGDRLPSLPSMRGMFAFSEICMRRALDELAAEGYLRKHKGSGIYLARDIGTWEQKGSFLYLLITVPGATGHDKGIGLAEYLRERNIGLRIMTWSGSPDQKIVKAAQEVQAVFVAGRLTEEWVHFLNSIGVPVIYVGSNACTRKQNVVDHDWIRGAELLMESFVAKGCRRIALINGEKDYYPSQLLKQGYMNIVKKYDLPVTENDIFWKPSFSADAMHDFLAQQEEYDAILCEGGALVHVLAFFHVNKRGANCVLGSTTRLDNMQSCDKLIFVKFSGNLTTEAGRLFFKSLEDDTVFKHGPCLLKAELVPEA